jgi:hypothetical protein
VPEVLVVSRELRALQRTSESFREVPLHRAVVERLECSGRGLDRTCFRS